MSNLHPAFIVATAQRWAAAEIELPALAWTALVWHLWQHLMLGVETARVFQLPLGPRR